ncbi:MAG: ABC transporter permease [Pseudomonadota bacterium]
MTSPSSRSIARFVASLARRDLLGQGEGSLLGLGWTILQPLLFFVLVWGVFTYGLRVTGVGGESFVIWFMVGYVPWVYFASCLTEMTGVIRGFAYLLPHQRIDACWLPLTKILSHAAIHGVYLAAVIGFAIAQGETLAMSAFGLIAYFIVMTLGVLGLGWIVASVSVFSKDLSNLTLIVTQFGFWLTPIFWNIEMLPERLQTLASLNPMAHIVAGYRRSIFATEYSSMAQVTDAVLLALTLVVVLLGYRVFKRLQVHFLEVLS